MLCVKLECLFIHIPKTGGNSIQDVLAPYSDDCRVSLNPYQDGYERFEVRNQRYPTIKHSTLSEYRSVYPPELFDRLFKFAVIRNTYERVLSHYFSPHRGVVAWDRDSLITFCREQVPPLTYYLGYDGQSLAEAITNVDELLRFDHLAEDFQRTCKTIGLANVQLHWRNMGPLSGRYPALSPELVEIVTALYEEEIEYFDFAPLAVSMTES